MKYDSSGYEICPECHVGHDLIHKRWITIGHCPCGCDCPIGFASKRKFILTKEHHGCSDGGCIFGHPGGMHTNGGCKCLDYFGREAGITNKIRLLKSITSLKKERDRLFNMLKESINE